MYERECIALREREMNYIMWYLKIQVFVMMKNAQFHTGLGVVFETVSVIFLISR